MSLAVAAIVASPSLAQDMPPPDCGLYLYRANIVRVIDGDTVVANIDLGFDVWLHNEHLRLVGIDTPENRTDAGKRVTEDVRAMIEGRTVYVCTVKKKRSDAEATGSFGRYLTVVWVAGINLNQWLLDTGRAVVLD